MAACAVGARRAVAVRLDAARRAPRRSPRAPRRDGGASSSLRSANGVDPDRGRLELRRARARVGGVDRQHVRVDELGEVQVHEREPGPQRRVERDRRLDLAAARGDDARGRRRRARSARRPRARRAAPRRRRAAASEKLPVWTPVLNDSSRRPVVRRSGNSSSSRSTGGECSTAMNGARLDRRRRPTAGRG